MSLKCYTNAAFIPLDTCVLVYTFLKFAPGNFVINKSNIYGSAL